MFRLKWVPFARLFWLLILVFLVSACNKAHLNPQEITLSPAAALTTTPTKVTLLEAPTATPLPAAAIVNGEVISLASFERELVRYLNAQEAQEDEGKSLDEARETVLNDLINQVLLAQGARDAGTELSNADVLARIDGLAEEVDLDAWMATWGYTREELIESLHLQLLTADQRERIAASIPEALEQVELRQVLAFTEAGAKRALASLNADVPFAEVAFEFSPETGGYIGWVPRGYLLIPAIEAAVFDLPVGSYTEIISSDVGYHIVLVMDREVRPLTADARLTLARQAVHNWLEDRRTSGVIEILID